MAWAFLLVLSCSGPFVGARAETLVVPKYEVGDVATADVVTPLPLIVIDPVQTDARRQQAANRVPAVYRFDAGVADDAERKLRAAFATARSNFLDRLETAYKKRQIPESAVKLPKFNRVMTSFQRQHRNFPLNTNVFATWATGMSDELVEAEWVTKVRRAMRQYIRENSWPPAIRSGPGQVQMLFARPTAALTLFDMDQGVINVARSNILGLVRARNDFQKSFSAEEENVGKYLAGYLRINCFYDPGLTAASRQRKTENIYAADHYREGQTLVQAGSVITEKVKAALEELRVRTAPAVAVAAVEQRHREDMALTRLETQAAVAQLQAETAWLRNRWLLLGLVATSLLALLAVWSMGRGRRQNVGLPVPVVPASEPNAVVACPACNEPVVLPVGPIVSPVRVGDGEAVVIPGANSMDDNPQAERYWKDQASRAEARADQATRILRAGLLPELARWLSNKFVRRLARDRRDLLVAQQGTGDEVAQLEKRLAEVQAPLQERLAAYETRITELEQQLAAKGEESREIIRAKIAETRRQLERERTKGEAALN